MKKRANSGFSVIELMILLAVISIIWAAVAPRGATQGGKSNRLQAALGGYLHTTTDKGALRQTLNEQGGGVPC